MKPDAHVADPDPQYFAGIGSATYLIEFGIFFFLMININKICSLYEGTAPATTLVTYHSDKTDLAILIQQDPDPKPREK
jgi:hypothetical protein